MTTTTIKNVRSMRGLGIFNDRDAKTPSLQFRRYNLIYGFNGSGKSTLSRLFASLQSGSRHPRLPPNCTFEIELDNETILTCPDRLIGVENHVIVFNTDFVEQNLRWSMARANPVFHLGHEQAELGAELASREADIPAAETHRTIASERAKTKEKALTLFKRERARLVAERLRLRGRKYEAPQLANDYEKMKFDETSLLPEEVLEGFSATCRLDKAMPKLAELSLQEDRILESINRVRILNSLTPSIGVLEELKRHPSMLLWIKQGHEYHTAHSLGACLFCSAPLSPDRKGILGRVLDDHFDHFLVSIEQAAHETRDILNEVQNLQAITLHSDNVPIDLRILYQMAAGKVCNAAKIVESILVHTAEVLNDKRRKPALVSDTSKLPEETDISKIVAELIAAIGALNAIVIKHNQNVDDFARYQENAQIAIRKHYLAESAEDYALYKHEQTTADSEAQAAEAAYSTLKASITELQNRIKKHGPAAAKMNKLIQSYLGHGELEISPIDEGYEIHRHGKLIEGFPSEGEKTAIALCYFLSTLESEGRKLKDLIVVIDDPISSLDTKALNFACALIRSRLSGAKQLFVLTHNQNCMNEFKKSWKNKAKPSEGKEQTATFLFINVYIPQGHSTRTSAIVEMSRLLREYDSEYHFLIHHVLKFSEVEDGEYEYAYMMPNVLRRVLEVFLAFKCPGNAGLASKIEQLRKHHDDLEIDRIAALERLAQAESHSDNLDDLIAFSSMALEETKDAAMALLVMMDKVDKAHLDGLRKICR